MKQEFTHFDTNGNARMVEVGEKEDTERIAIAKGTIFVGEKLLKIIMEGSAKKGDVLGTARIAGIMGAKKTSELIPLCHIILITGCTIDFVIGEETGSIDTVCTVKTVGKTGVEMEALTGVNIALLTIYDMCKAINRAMKITDIHLVKKDGGKSGLYESN